MPLDTSGRQSRLSFSDPLCKELGHKCCLCSRALHGIAGRAEQLKVVDVVASTARPCDDVIHGEIAERKEHPAPGADAFLPAIERVFVRSVIWKLAKVRSARDIRAAARGTRTSPRPPR